MIGYSFTQNKAFLGIVILLLLSPSLFGQTNLVTNPSFEDISDCDIEFGEAAKAFPWKNLDDSDVFTPDLFHECSTGPFYGIPSGGCNVVYPRTGDGMVGIVNLYAEEGIYARLNDDIPLNQDIYVSFSVVPRKKCFAPLEQLCYSNTPCLVFSDIQFQSQNIVLQSDTIIYETEDWTTMHACFQANGSEKYVSIGNFKSAVDELRDCNHISETNFSYFHVDDVIVSPFDVVPDTLYLCGDDEKELDASFFGLPISWSDGLNGAIRTIEDPGFYTVMAEVEDCFLTDNMVVIQIPDEVETKSVTICDGSEYILTTQIPALWPNGKVSKSFEVNRAGIYSANLQNECGDRIQQFEVLAESCGIDYYVPTAFSPNGDGLNDEMEFYFNSDFEFIGDLYLYDRWGNLLHQYLEIKNGDVPRWDGILNGKKMNPAVFVWMFKYRISKDGKERLEVGDFVLF